VRGVVRDRSGAPSQGARVWLAGTSLTATTDGTGLYCFPMVPSGIYNVTGSKSGYTAVSQQGTAVVGGSVTNLDLQLSK